MSDEWNDDFGWDDGGITEGDLGGSRVEQEGWYHFSISSIKADWDINGKYGPQAPNISFSCKVEAGEPNAAKPGSMLFHTVNVAGKGGGELEEIDKKKILTFARGMGLAEQVESNGTKSWLNPQTKKPFHPKMLLELEGKHFIAKVKHRRWESKKNGKTGDVWEIPFGNVYSPEDPRASGHPMDLEILDIAGYNVAAIKEARGDKEVETGGTASEAGEPDNF